MINKDKAYITGDIITIPSRTEHNYDYCLIVTKDSKPFFELYNLTLNVANYDLFIEYLKDNNIRDVVTAPMKSEKKICVSSKTILNPNLKLSYDFDFLVASSPENIYSDASGKIKNIMIAKTHITYTSSIINDDIAKYFTLIILGYNNIYNNIKNHSRIVLVDKGTLYASRYCQNSKIGNRLTKRKPVIIDVDSISDTTHTKVSARLYTGNTEDRVSIKPSSKTIYKQFRYGDIYVDENNLGYKCIDDAYPYIGFITPIYNISGVCYPCCYAKQVRDNIFDTCVYNKPLETTNELDPYIISFGRLLLTNKLSYLPKNINTLLNSSSIIKCSSTSKITKAVNYNVVYKYEVGILIKDFKDMYSFCYDNKCILISENKIYCNPDIHIDDVTQVVILIQKRVHSIKCINKDINEHIIMSNDKPATIKILYDKFTIPTIDKLNKSHVNVVVKQDNIYIKGKHISIPCRIKSFVEYPIPNKSLNSVSTVIANQYKNYLTNNIYTDDLETFKSLFITNIMDKLNISDKFCTSPSELINMLEKLN